MRAVCLSVLLLPGIFLADSSPALAAACAAPQTWVFKVSGTIHRDVPGFTEGLEVHDGRLYESTGDVVGETRINIIDRRTGRVSALRNDHHAYFGEGLTFFNNRIYQMSWREHRVFVFDLQGRKRAELKNPREGWGLTHDRHRLIASDGSSRLFFLAPGDFRTLGSVTVRVGDQELPSLNELEYVDGAVWANVFQDWRVVKIDPASGCVRGVADLSFLHTLLTPAERAQVDKDANFVLNGIAHDPADGSFIVTGKYWPVLFTGRFVPEREGR